MQGGVLACFSGGCNASRNTTHIVATPRARPLDEAVREEALVVDAVRLLARLLLKQAVGVNVAVNVLHELGLLGRRGAAKVVKADVEPPGRREGQQGGRGGSWDGVEHPLVCLLVQNVKLVAQLARGDAFLEGLPRRIVRQRPVSITACHCTHLGLGRRAILVRPADLRRVDVCSACKPGLALPRAEPTNSVGTFCALQYRAKTSAERVEPMILPRWGTLLTSVVASTECQHLCLRSFVGAQNSGLTRQRRGDKDVALALLWQAVGRHLSAQRPHSQHSTRTWAHSPGRAPA